MGLLSTQLQRRSFGLERANGLIVDTRRRNGNEFLLRIAKCGELAAEHAAGINVDGAVQPFGFGNGSVAVNDRRLPTVVGGPVISDLKTKLIHFAGSLSEQCKVADFAGTAALHLFLHARMSNNETAAIENIVADQGIEKFRHLVAKFRRLFIELFQSFGDAVSQLHVAAAKFAQEFDVVVAGHAVGVALLDHVHDQPQHAGRVRSTVSKIA